MKLNKEKIVSVLKRHKKLFLAALALIGIALLILPSAARDESESASLSEYKRELEDELEDMISQIDGAGRCSVTVTFSDGERYGYSGSRITSVSPPRVLGVSVVCEGGGSSEVAERISDAVTALFDIGANRVCILKMK